MKNKVVLRVNRPMYIDQGSTKPGKLYTREEAITLIKSILIQDKELLNGRSVDSMSDDDILEIGHYHYSITLK